MLAIFDGRKLREIREQQDVSQAELAARAGTTIRYVRALEKGRKRNPSAEQLHWMSPWKHSCRPSRRRMMISTMNERQNAHSLNRPKLHEEMVL